MRSFPVGIVVGVLAAIFAGGVVQAADGGRTVLMPFQECLAIIAEAAEDSDSAPVELARTSEVRTVRIDAADGFVTLSCSRPDNRMLLTKTSAPGRVAAR